MKTKERGREKRRRRRKGCTQLTSIKEQERREEEKEKTGVTDDDGCKETEEECWGEDEVSDGRIDDACLATLPFPARDSLSYSPTYLPSLWLTSRYVFLSSHTHLLHLTIPSKSLHRTIPAFAPLVPVAFLPYLAFILLAATFALAFYFST